MARGKEKNGNDAVNTIGIGRSANGWNGGDKPVFVEGYLDGIDKDWLSNNADKSLEHIAELVESIGEEYTLSCKLDSTSGRFMASLTCRIKNHPNSGCVLVSRGSTPVNALYALSYRHFFKFEQDWRSQAAASGDDWD